MAYQAWKTLLDSCEEKTNGGNHDSPHEHKWFVRVVGDGDDHGIGAAAVFYLDSQNVFGGKGVVFFPTMPVAMDVENGVSKRMRQPI